MTIGNIRIVLVSPIYGGNVGSVCRAMANMGLSDLVIAGPRPFEEGEARARACWATELLDGRRECATLAEAVHDCGLVAGATAREGLYRSHARTPREWAPHLLAASQFGKVALVFGPEDNGLANEDLALCTQIVRIPTTAEYSSLNLSHAVIICCYELFVASGTYELPGEKSAEAPSDLRERMFALWREALLAVGFMKEDKADHMMLGLRRIFSRGRLSTDDARILMGIARQTQWCASQVSGSGTATADRAGADPE